MSSLIERVAREAKITFSKEFTDPDFMDNFRKLVWYVGKLQETDLKVDDSLKTASNYIKQTSPCLYIRVFSSETFTIGIFILMSGEKIPLHDHPGMYGIMKVIKGSVKIQAYSSVADESGGKVVPQDVKDKIVKSEGNNAVFTPVNKHEPIIVGENDQPCILRPKEGNFNEVYSVDTMAVFLDVLAPPYDMVERNCTFFEALESAKPDAEIKTWLVKKHPNRFYSTDLPYCGPEIK